MMHANVKPPAYREIHIAVCGMCKTFVHIAAVNFPQVLHK